jgi:sigma-B regulation protein RsbU (phosphoserine phosphatase)
LPKTNFHEPSEVLAALNKVFRADYSGGRFFTIWYGVYSVQRRTLSFSGGGHPHPLLFGATAPSAVRPSVLPQCGPPIGISDELNFSQEAISVPAGARLLLFSDGVVEIQKPHGGMADQQSFAEFASIACADDNLLERILQRARQIHGGATLNDDCSLMQIDFL